jgi:hypothetical protein
MWHPPHCLLKHKVVLAVSHALHINTYQQVREQHLQASGKGGGRPELISGRCYAAAVAVVANSAARAIMCECAKHGHL